MPVFERGVYTIEAGYALYRELVANGAVINSGPVEYSFAMSAEEARDKVRNRPQRAKNLDTKINEVANKMRAVGKAGLVDADRSPCRKTFRITPTNDYQSGDFRFSELISEDTYRAWVEGEYI
jgi:hypothetical protein